MCRFIDAGRSVLKQPILWLALIVWAVGAVLVHSFVPASPSHHVEIENDFETPLTTFGDKSTIVTTVNEGVGSRKLQVRFRDARQGEMIGEIETNGMNLFYHNPISRNDRWIGFANRNDQIPWIEIYDTSTRQKAHAISSSEAVFSNKSDCMAHRDETLQILDLHTGKSRVLSDVKASPRCFSGDDRYLACVSDKFIVVLDASSGAPVTTLAISANDEAHVNRIEFSPDGESLVWQVGGTVMVTDLKGQNRCVIEKAQFEGWLSSERILTAQPRQFSRPTRFVDVWDWRNSRKVARWDLPPEIEPVVGHMKTWAVPPEIFIEPSADGRHVLFANYAGDRAPAPWLAKVREWLKLPNERGLHLEVFMLDGETLALEDHWQIPAKHSRDVLLQFTPDGSHVVFTDGYVIEHWPASRSWLRSIAWGAASLVLLTPIFFWRFSRKRRDAARRTSHSNS